MILFINVVLMATVSKIVKLLYNLYKNRYEKRSVSYAPFSVHISESRYFIIFYEWSINVCRFLQSLQVQSLDLPLLQRLRTMFGTLMP